MSEVSLDTALAALNDHAIPGKADDMRAYHKVDRPYLGVANPILNDHSQLWRRELNMEQRMRLANDLWATNIHEARVCAAKLFTQARIKPSDDAVWDIILNWLPDLDGWAIADHVASAAQRRLEADPLRLDTVETWTTSPHLWTKRAALVCTLPWTKYPNPKPNQITERERILGWAAEYVDDPQWFIQKSVSWWLRELSRRDPDRVLKFIDAHGAAMKNFARKDATRLINKS